MAKDRREQDRQPVHEINAQERRRYRCSCATPCEGHSTAAGAGREGNGNLDGNVDVVTVECGADPRGRDVDG